KYEEAGKAASAALVPGLTDVVLRGKLSVQIALALHQLGKYEEARKVASEALVPGLTDVLLRGELSRQIHIPLPHTIQVAPATSAGVIATASIRQPVKDSNPPKLQQLQSTIASQPVSSATSSSQTNTTTTTSSLKRKRDGDLNSDEEIASQSLTGLSYNDYSGKRTLNRP
ncbi:MAG TPA: hypothetical protein VIJ14_00535, partial [Rhabdochlamydiaceae bacterium]